jgi:hypothetical protein
MQYEELSLFPATSEELMSDRISKLEKKMTNVQGGLYARFHELEKKYFEALERILLLESQEKRSKLVASIEETPSKRLAFGYSD